MVREVNDAIIKKLKTVSIRGYDGAIPIIIDPPEPETHERNVVSPKIAVRSCTTIIYDDERRWGYNPTFRKVFYQAGYAEVYKTPEPVDVGYEIEIDSPKASWKAELVEKVLSKFTEHGTLFVDIEGLDESEKTWGFYRLPGTTSRDRKIGSERMLSQSFDFICKGWIWDIDEEPTVVGIVLRRLFKFTEGINSSIVAEEYHPDE